jgi:hypothetical protein
MAKDLISIMTGLAQTDVEINVVYCLPPKVKAHLDAAAQARQVEAEARSRAAAEQRAAARVLREEQDLTLADIGAVLGVTHQRAHQLTTA